MAKFKYVSEKQIISKWCMQLYAINPIQDGPFQGCSMKDQSWHKKSKIKVGTKNKEDPKNI